ncbi:hypothetical protein SLEP1_g25897 [Rubroshorea leprosula]|uniref:Disease resistance protein n=1 Tax=Rubroshorea leprosula TaxID=152421 RepID=A0AAV5JUU5_9ROSI|nr:hypothetical protein SLEP1_g25897 [Rubroshorea leprosula]
MAEIVGAIFGALSCICGTPTCNCIDQHRNFNDDVDELRRKLDNLTSQKQDIESRIQEAEARRGQMVRQQVQEWLKQAEEINVKLQAFLEKVQGVKWYKRACLDRLVCRKINMVKEMLDKGSFPKGLVIERALAHGNIIPTENLVGQVSTKEEIWRYLMGDEVGMIGVCGIGGVGKTMIMKNLHNDLLRETRFEKVIWVTVSDRLNVFELQKKIADDMGQRLRDDEEVMMRAAALMEIMTRIGEECVVLPNNLEDLWIIEGRNMRSSLNKTVTLEMEANELRRCCIWDCEEIECVVELDSSSSSSLCCPVLDKLELLQLWTLPKLCEVVRAEGAATPSHIFSNLKTLIIEDCPGMRKLLPPELQQAFQNLEEIEVGNCKQMEEIIASSDSYASSDKFTFPKLRRLCLWYLPQLKSICSAKGVMVCDSIEKIQISRCQELKRIPVQLPLLDNGQPSPPPHLREINMDKDSKEWWESVEWDHKNLLHPFLKYFPW